MLILYFTYEKYLYVSVTKTLTNLLCYAPVEMVLSYEVMLLCGQQRWIMSTDVWFVRRIKMVMLGGMGQAARCK